MRIFFDCEFTSLTEMAKLISVGVVSECGNYRYYTEIREWQLEECSDFVQSVVIPLLEYPEDDRLEFSACQAAFYEWLVALDDLKAAGNSLEIVADSIWDWHFIKKLLGDRMAFEGPYSGRFAFDNGREVNLIFRLFSVSNALVERIFLLAANAWYHGRQHHALVDARALRAGVLAVEASMNMAH